jgi:Ca-activated chloride channel family protein
MRRGPRAAPLAAAVILCGLAAGAQARRQERQTPQDKSAPALKSAPAAKGTPAPAQTPAEIGEEEVLRVDTTLVAVPVSVQDSSGRYVADLRKEDFRVFEDGVEQEIAYFAPVERPFTVALLLDTSDSLRFRLQDVQDAAVAFVEQLRPADRVMVVSFSSRVDILCEPTSDRETLRRAIRRSHTQGGTRVYDALDFVVRERLERIAGGRKAIILFTDGIDTGSFHSTRDSTLRHMEESDVLAYAVQYGASADAGGRWRDAVNAGGAGAVMPGGAPTDPAAAARAAAYLRELSRTTGARHYRAENLESLRRAFAEVAAELRQQYSLGYYPKPTARDAGVRRRIKVTVGRPKLNVRARAAYVPAARP